MSAPFSTAPLGLGLPVLALDALAGRISTELASLAGLSCEVQRALSLCQFADHTAPEAIRGLQGLDRITQALDDLARLMAALSHEVPPTVELRAHPLFAQLRLHELICNLNPNAAQPEAGPQAVGEIQWF